MTEDELRKKWCPHTRYEVSGNIGAICKGSTCSQFRRVIWVDKHGADVVRDVYCGLAGRP